MDELRNLKLDEQKPTEVQGSGDAPPASQTLGEGAPPPPAPPQLGTEPAAQSPPPGPPEPPAAPVMTVSQDPRYERYFKMVKMV